MKQPKPLILPAAKRTAFDHLGRPVEGRISEEIAAALGCRAGVIKLLTGAQGHGGGFGLRHIESYASRVKIIKKLGFRDAHAYVGMILANFVHCGVQKDGRLVLVAEAAAAHFHHLICEWDDALEIWSVTTAIPKRHMREIAAMAKVWRRAKGAMEEVAEKA